MNNSQSNKGRDEAAAGQPQGAHGLRVLRPLLSRRHGPVSLTVGEAEPYRGTVAHLVISAVLLTVLLSAIIALPLPAGQVQIEPGMPAASDIYSPSYTRYESKILTANARAEATDDPANEVWVQDASVVQTQRSILLKNLSHIEAARNEVGTLVQNRAGLKELEGVTLTQEMVDVLLEMGESDYRYWRDSGVLTAFDRLMRDRRLTSAAEVEAARASIGNVLVPSLDAQQKAVAAALLSPVLVVNMRLDQAQTAERREAAAAQIMPVVQTVQKGEVILRQGELASPEAIEKMQELGLLSREISLPTILSTTVLVGLMMLLLHMYMYRYVQQVWKRQKQLLLVALLVLVTLAAGRIFLPGHGLLPYLMPVAAVSMLIAALISTNLAVVVTVTLSVLLGVVANNALSLDLPVYYFVGGLAGIFSLTRVEKVSTFARAGFFVATGSFVVALAMRVLSNSVVDGNAVQLLAFAAVFNGVVSASVTYATFSLLGMIFGITTPVQLMELAHPDQPLLRRLMQEAPGTYHHSLVVSNLAERAAEMIGADALLTRVCAYYHDIGKVERPYYFIDNQSGMSNVHDRLNPAESAAIIANHVRDGVRLGEKYRLPRRVLDAIPQHHGTMLIKYFYYKALKDNPNSNPDHFRYPGPKPQSKENAILMLADGVEATIRSMAQSGALDRPATASSDATESPALYNDTATLPDDTIASAVHKIIAERIEDGQLDECDLTVRDIARIQEAFVSMLKGIYHPRIAYPEAPKQPQAVVTEVSDEPAVVVPSTGMFGTGGNGHTKQPTLRPITRPGEAEEPV